MRKTFAVGKLLGGYSRILLLEGEATDRTPPRGAVALARLEARPEPLTAHPETVH